MEYFVFPSKLGFLVRRDQILNLSISNEEEKEHKQSCSNHKIKDMSRHVDTCKRTGHSHFQLQNQTAKPDTYHI